METKVLNTDEDLLSTEELLLLELLTYYVEPDGKTIYNSENFKPGMTVADYLYSNMNDYTDPTLDYSAGMNMYDMEEIRDAILQNDNLPNCKIVETHIDTAEGGGEGKSILFINEETGEAVVAFRGTEKDEWADNFYGGGNTAAKDGVSTPQQENALEWYKEIYKEYGLEDYYVTLTGHSKGSNKAVYTTILDDTVDRCVGYDGQGMSDEFMWRYAEKIVAREDYIENHNVNYDFVNPLLNTIGKTTFYVGQNVDSIVENHSPNSFLKFGENGEVTMVEDTSGRPQEMVIIDEFLNSYLRSLNEGDKEVVLELIGDIAQGVVDKEESGYFINLILKKENLTLIADLIDYFGDYLENHPELFKAIQLYVHKNNMEKPAEIIDTIEIAGNYPIPNMLDTIGDVVSNSGITWLDGNVIEILSELDLFNGDDLDADVLLHIKESILEYLQPFINILCVLYERYKESISVIFGTILKDRARGTSSSSGKNFYVSPTHMSKAITSLSDAYSHLAMANKKLINISGHNFGSASIKSTLEDIKFRINQEAYECDKLALCLHNIKNLYERNEQLLAGN